MTDVGLLYGEDHGRVVVSCDPTKEAAFKMLAEEYHVPYHTAGFVGEPGSELAITTGNATYRWPIAALRECYMTAIPRRMGHIVENAVGR